MAAAAQSVDLAAIETWQQALDAFPCPECAKSPYTPTGLREVGHGFTAGTLYDACHICQPEGVQQDFNNTRARGLPMETATKLARPTPARFTWEWVSSYPAQVAVIDRADNSRAWEGRPDRDNGFSAQRRIDLLNAKWWQDLADRPR